MLDAQVFVNLLLKLAVRMNFIRHGNFLSEGSSQKAIRFHASSYRWQSRCSYCACAGFLIATPGVIRDPSFGGDFTLKHQPPHHHVAVRPETAQLRQDHRCRRRNRIHTGS
jgi:hypothetical protein